MRRLIAAAALLALSPCLAGQVSKGEGTSAHRKRIDESIEQMRRSIREGTPVITNARVTIWLRNEHRLKGVVKGGRFVERPSGLDFVRAQKQAPGAGIRVWYHDDTDSFIFLPFEAIARYKVGSRLTEVDLKEIVAKISRRGAAAGRQRGARAAGRPGVTGSEKPKAEPTGESPAARLARIEREERLLGLLKEFPPDDGWGSEKLAEINRRKVVIGAYPDAESGRFVSVFSDWQQAVEINQRRMAEAEARPPAAGEPPRASSPR